MQHRDRSRHERVPINTIHAAGGFDQFDLLLAKERQCEMAVCGAITCFYRNVTIDLEPPDTKSGVEFCHGMLKAGGDIGKLKHWPAHHAAFAIAASPGWGALWNMPPFMTAS